MSRRRSSLAFTVALSLAAAAACGIPSGLGKNGMDRLIEQRQFWEANGPLTYEYEIRNLCNCYMAGMNVRVVVHDGLLDSASLAHSGQRVDDAGMLTFRGVDGMFAELADAYARRAADVDVIYDETYGYPRYVYIDYATHLRSDNRSWTVSSFRAIP
jgi:hypothetical protein